VPKKESTLAEQTLQVERLTATLGAEVSGVDFREPMSAEREKEIHETLLEHQVLFFRDQDLSPDQHKAIGESFGELHVPPVLPSRAEEGHPEIVVLQSCQPPLGSVLRGVLIPDQGGDTLFASTTAAFDGLSDSMQRMLSGLEAEHDGGVFSYIANENQKKDLAKNQATAHPVVRTHPETGRKSIYVNATFTTRIKDMKRRESEALLGFLYTHTIGPEYTCRFRWRTNSIAIWDNRCTQHRVATDDIKAPRRMERVTVIGDEPY